MRILFTSDWQADYENLDLCKRAAKEILEIKRRQNVQALVVAGDLKHAYNPVDVRIVNFWLKTIGSWKKEGLEVLVNLGNHDRVGLHVDKQNWLPVLRKGGAQCFDDPGVYGSNGSARIRFLPYRKSPVLLKREAYDLARGAQADRDVLVFHTDLQSARFNVLSRSDGGLPVEDLCGRKYLYCVGGHYHMQQRVQGNVWYVGSPFSTDWGEANQRKGYLLIDTEAGEIRRIRSSIPGWYDPSWPGFEEARPKSWQGTRVRIKVPCDGVQHVREKLEQAELEARGKYIGADIVVIPEFHESGGRGSGKIEVGFPDEKKIRIYVQETLPDEMRRWEKTIRNYLLEQLAQVGGLQRENDELKFRKWEASNFLSYRKLSFKLEKGLYVVVGKNMDWAGRSNGAGKTSFLQPIVVAHSGQTFKGQKHDSWMRRGTGKDEEAYVRIWFEDAKGHSCSLRRARQPKEIKLEMNGELVDSGNRPETTQKLIEQATGYTWETLTNTIYMDQTKSHLMLTGTPAERKSFLAKLQNLERFERAEKLVKTQKTLFDERYSIVFSKLQSVLTEEKGLQGAITDARKILALNASIRASYERVSAKYEKKRDALREWDSKAKKERSRLEKELEEYYKAKEQIDSQRGSVETRLSDLRKRQEKLENLEGVCKTCGQKINEENVGEQLEKTAEAIRALGKEQEAYEKIRRKGKDFVQMNEKEMDKWRRNQELAIEVEDLRVELEKLRYGWKQYRRQEELIAGWREKINSCRQKASELEKKKGKISKWLGVLKYAQSVFQKDGLPAYLNRQLCPAMNRAAEEYGELFSQGEIQVRFEVDEEGKLDVQVINAHGGQEIDDQSGGELKMASLITCFAVRTIAPKTNILILDEPGDGLDSTSAKGFARGLRKVVDRFGTILLTTHNASILAELAEARMVVVEKKNGVSEVSNG